MTEEPQRRGVASAVKRAFPVALPVMLGYLVIGVPAGILEGTVGIAPAEAFLMSVTLYTGAGQFMIPNLVMAGQSVAAIVTSVSLVNTRQMLYSAAFAPWFNGAPKALTALFSATVTDESFGVNVGRFDSGDWDCASATAVNILSMLAWACANAVGALVGDVISLPTDVASFAMTSIFLCLMLCQDLTRANVVAAAAAIVATVLCKCLGLGSMAIITGAVLGVALGLVCGGDAEKGGEAA
ncbi:AzlC family ABC transporter permease [Olsenella sp. YH-ols2217]|uniref:AzlC family ABC transporter permease n=1 Tax=Kribbibacterium absianum TaxID=3044210 RepID=A0ABT6ZLH1_9ACTN|nr:MULTISPECIES: AzlC family ABC transporter permease [unclassified Olsenella]MDJ1121885.1 AzlC family ABC transporter permease [Olsenella sp. YH-ols2216]MDJ1129893.1 AzlC family ABC transporter permease [Olsenella sp. YH-ols2217]